MAKGWLIGGAAFLLVLLVASIVVAMLDKEDVLPEGTPQAAVQDFLNATSKNDYQAVYGYLAEDLKANCTLEAFISTSRGPSDSIRDNRITLEETSIVDGSAFVTVRITQFSSGGPFGTPNDYSYSQNYTLRQEGGQWRFVQQYPWPFYSCGFIERGPFQEPLPIQEPVPTLEPTPTPELAP